MNVTPAAAAEPPFDWRQRAFTSARSHSVFTAEAVDESLLRHLYDTLRWGPTSMNCQPLRLKFMRSLHSRERLAQCVYEGNRAKVLSAPVCAVLGMDLDFPATLHELFAHKPDAAAYFAGDADRLHSTALRNSSLQGGYLLVAARLLGLDCGPMSGFDAAGVDALCWAGTRIRTNFLCNLGYADGEAPFARSPRLDFDRVCRIE
ncbi:MAG: malonic semialdehyde reductase [Chitinophagaceae bacterium]|nr:malonic semialdehyde reductase [Rubrivivax sp.]